MLNDSCCFSMRIRLTGASSELFEIFKSNTITFTNRSFRPQPTCRTNFKLEMASHTMTICLPNRCILLGADWIEFFAD